SQGVESQSGRHQSVLAGAAAGVQHPSSQRTLVGQPLKGGLGTPDVPGRGACVHVVEGAQRLKPLSPVVRIASLTSSLSLPPGPGASGSLRVMVGLHHDPVGTLSGLTERYGDIVHFRLGPQRVYVITRADLIRQVLVTNQKSFKKGPGF